MLQRMREHTSGLMAKVLLGVLVVVFALFGGFIAFEGFNRESPAANINGEKITRNALEMETERQRQRIVNELGDQAPPELLDANVLQARVLDGLINRTLLMQTADDLALGVSEAQVDDLIRTTPQFQTDGEYDPEVFRKQVANIGQTPMTYRAELGRSVRLMQLNGSLTETGIVTSLERRQTAALLSQRRDVAYATFDPATIADAVTVDDARVKDYYDKHLDEFMTEEKVDVDYVELSPADLMNDPSIVVTDEDVQALYESERTTFVPQERRRASHILLETGTKRSVEDAEATLRAAKERVAKGESFATVAKELSEDPGSAAQGGDLGFNPKGIFVPEFEEALWALKPGELSDPVRTQFGVHLIRLDEIKADSYPELDAMKDELRTRLVRQHADELYATKVRRLEQVVFEAQDTLDPAAQELGIETKHADGLTRSTGPGIFAEAVFRDAAFGTDVLERGFNSSAIEHDNRAVSVRVRTHHEATQRPLEEVTDVVRKKLVDQEARDLARTRADDALGRLTAGEAVSQVSEEAQVQWKVAESARRRMPDVPPQVLVQAFDLPRPAPEGRSAGIAELDNGAVAVVVVTRVMDGDYAELTEAERKSLDRQLAQRAGQADLTSVFDTVKDAASIKRI